MRAHFYTALSRIRAFLRPGAGDGDFDEEVAAHLALAEDEKIRRGLSPEQARREARLELGGTAQLREAARSARGLPWLDTFWLDGKIGLRMLRQAWGLTVVGGLAMALTIGLGASIYTIWETFNATRLPLDEGERIVAIQPFDRASQSALRSTPFPDFERWRDALRSVGQVSAMRVINPTVSTPAGPLGAVMGAEITASAFPLARVQPLLGRPLSAEDERAGSEPVAVIGHDIWQDEFASDPAVVGKRIRVNGTPHTVVGVMPDGYRFPLNQRLWIPLRTDVIGGRADDVFVFARLVPGATVERAHAEVMALGLLTDGSPSRRSGKPADSAAAAASALQPRVVPYAAGVFPDVHDNGWASGVLFLIGALLLVPPCASIAILVYARTLTRRHEFAARTALGASRGRIVMQLFVELLLLATAAGVAGLLIARQFSGRIAGIVMPGSPNNLPFWMELSPSIQTVLSVAAFTLLAAAIAGAIPAFQATRRWGQSGLQALGHRGADARLGRTWTALLGTQIALSLAIMPAALEMSWGIFRPAILGPAVAVDEFLTGWLVMEGDASRFETISAEAVRRLSAAPGISGVTASAAVLMEEPSSDIEMEGLASGDQVSFNSVDRHFFDVLGVRFLAGRGFDARDFAPAGTAVVVNRSFVEEILGGASPLGRRVRYVERERTGQASEPSRWYEIVGVVQDFPAENDGPQLYHPMATPVQPLNLTIRATSGLSAAAARLREVSAALDPGLRVGQVQSLAEIFWQRRSLYHTLGAVLGAVMVLVLLFSTAGVYTLMAFIVAQRWREIGVRSALGADPRRLVAGILARAAAPLLLGAIAGCAGAAALQSSLPIVEAGGRTIPGVVPASAALLTLAGLLAVTRPARRAIRINPTDALRVN
jgi:predicted permease